MNENLNLVEILKDCPKGTKLYSTIHGEVEFGGIGNSGVYRVEFKTENEGFACVTSDGRHFDFLSGECILFPSKDQRDWSKFSAPWYQNGNIEKFDPRTLRAFDKILVRDSRIENWYAAQFSHIMYDLSEYEYDDCGEKVDFIICAAGATDFNYCIPFNDDTKSLLGTAKDAPKVYKYWED